MSNAITNVALIELYKIENNITEDLHTYTKWQALGYQVKKGEKSQHCITIWKHITKTKKVDEENEVVTGKCIMKKAFFFTTSQVEKIEKSA